MHLRTLSHWLLIFDNASAVQHVQPWLPSGSGHVIVTSRSPVWGAVADKLDVDVFNRREATKLLKRRIPRLDSQVADELATELGDLPLALAQASAYIEKAEISPNAYVSQLRQSKELLLQREDDHTYGGPVESAWSISYSGLQGSAPATVQLLQLASACAPEEVPIGIFRRKPDLLPEPLATASTDSGSISDLDEVVAAALSYALCRRRDDAIQLHRLLQAAIQAQLSVEERHDVRNTVVRLLSASCPGNPDDPTTWPHWEALGPHILHLFSTTQQDDRLKLGQLVDLYSWYFLTRGDYEGARRIAENLYDFNQEALGPDNKTTLSSAANLATILRAAGELELSLSLCRNVMSKSWHLFGEAAEFTLHAANNLVSGLRAAGANGQAIAIGEVTLNRCQATLGAGHEMTLAAAGNLAGALCTADDFERARELAADVYARFRQEYGEDHRETLWAATTLIEILHAQGNDFDAKPLAEATLSPMALRLGSQQDAVVLEAVDL